VQKNQVISRSGFFVTIQLQHVRIFFQLFNSIFVSEQSRSKFQKIKINLDFLALQNYIVIKEQTQNGHSWIMKKHFLYYKRFFASYFFFRLIFSERNLNRPGGILHSQICSTR